MSDMSPSPHESEWRHHPYGTGTWMAGIVLILLGVAFLLETAGIIPVIGNWWAIFIYLAALLSFANVWRASRGRGFGRQATGSLVWGLALTVVASIFLFDLSWSVWWPLILIAVGVGLTVGYLAEASGRKTPSA